MVRRDEHACFQFLTFCVVFFRAAAVSASHAWLSCNSVIDVCQQPNTMNEMTMMMMMVGKSLSVL